MNDEEKRALRKERQALLLKRAFRDLGNIVQEAAIETFWIMFWGILITLLFAYFCEYLETLN